MKVLGVHKQCPPLLQCPAGIAITSPVTMVAAVPDGRSMVAEKDMIFGMGKKNKNTRINELHDVDGMDKKALCTSH